jgi:hypothetical protein
MPDQALREQDRNPQIAAERHVAGGADDGVDVFRLLDPIGEKTASLRTCSVIDPIGTCQGLKSANSPRMVTRTRGNPQFGSSEAC